MKRLLVLALACCSSSEPSMESVKLGPLNYEVPSGWASRDLSSLLRPMMEWKPSDDNDRKESLIVSRVENPSLTVEKSRAHLKRRLVEANSQLPDASFTAPRAFVTRTGLFGLRVDGHFTPTTQTATYYRTHAVLVDGTSLVHVLYTARDPERESIEAVLDGFKPGA